MLRVRIAGRTADAEQLRTIGEDRRGVRPRRSPTSPTGRTCSTTGSGSRTCRDLAAARGGGPVHHARPAATRRGTSSAARWPASTRTRSSTRAPSSRATEAVARAADDLTNLPRKYKTAISGCASLLHGARDQRRLLRRRDRTRTRTPASTSGWAAGCPPTRCSPSGSARSSSRTGPRRVAGRDRLFRDYGYRRLRSRARLKFLVADWGTERFREVLEKEYLGGALPDGPAPAPPAAGAPGPRRGPPAGRRPVLRRRGAPRVGRTSGRQLRDVAALAADVRLRPGPDDGRAEAAHPRRAGGPSIPCWPRCRQDLLVGAVGVPPRHDGLHRDRVLQARDRGDQGPRPAALRRAGAAAAGFDTPISINVNGCPNSCARFQVADIGLKGSIRATAARGLPGAPRRLPARGTEAGFGRKLRGLKVTADELPGLRRAAAADLPGAPGATASPSRAWVRARRRGGC